MFAERPDARPKLHICPAHWRCHEENLALIAALELEEAFEVVTPPAFRKPLARHKSPLFFPELLKVFTVVLHA